MFQKGMLLLCLLAATFCSRAQIISSSVIASAGDYDKTGSISLEWTVGELVTEADITGFGKLTQGFHQPIIILPTTFVDLLTTQANDYNVKIFPNPVQAVLQVSIKGKTDNKLQVKLLDMSGKLLFLSTTYNRQQLIQININPYAAGTYLISITDTKGATIKTFKVVKVL